jgi:hypothetical protein
MQHATDASAEARCGMAVVLYRRQPAVIGKIGIAIKAKMENNQYVII